MAKQERQISLAGYLLVPTAHHHGAWRHPQADPAFLTQRFWVETARIYERGLFDMVFMPDVLAIQDQIGDFGPVLKRAAQSAMQLDPVVTLAMIAAQTTHIGLGATRSATFFPPFEIARSMASLDHLSGGRAAWNVVMSLNNSEAKNFGLDEIPGRQERYDRGDETVEAICALWDSWEEGAVIGDKEAGVFADPEKVSYVDYEGKWIRTRGPLTLPRTPQGRPVIMQAGSSDRGRQFAARWGEVLFALAHALPEMQAYYKDMKERTVAAGRRAEDVKILNGVQIVVGETTEIAAARRRYLNDLISPEVGVVSMSYHLGVDLTAFPLDAPLEEIDVERGSKGSLDVILQGSKAGSLTLAEAAVGFATSELTPQIVGTPAEIADELEHYFVNEGCDGFMITPGPLPASAAEIVDMVIPELQRRGLYRSAYPEDPRLRATLGLPFPGVA
jgi:FMN-dependent oxidoreductase (nitrilotriacetate monooxygenase family)